MQIYNNYSTLQVDCTTFTVIAKKVIFANVMKRIALASVFLIAAVSCFAIGVGEIRFDDIDRDTTAINRWLEEGSKIPGRNMAKTAMLLEGITYKAATLEEMPEMLTINTSAFDCTTFAETVLALEITLRERRTSWRDFAHNLRALRYRGGRVDGYSSRLHYVSDWIIDNTHRGLVEEVTSRVGEPLFVVKTLDFMTRNAKLYPALADSTEYAAMKAREDGYRRHRYPYISKRSIAKAKIKEGDLLMLTTSKSGLDVTHMGIACFKNGVLHLIHASSKGGKVIADTMPLEEYFRKNPSLTGVRVVRLSE